MTSPGNLPTTDDDQAHAERRYRSPAGIAGGVLLLALAGWLGGDAVLTGSGNVPWLALAGLLAVVPLVVAFTLRPVVRASAVRLLVRNPFRTITLPWECVEGVRAGYSSEVLAAGRTYQLWAIPVSLRKRKAAARRQVRAAAADTSGRTPVSAAFGSLAPGEALRAPSDQAVEELRELASRGAAREGARGASVPQVRWAYEVLVPCLVGLVLLGVLLGVG
ncbi:PH domain-containing protein [Streptomyces gamaensis]|uniref:PH domain-containing protein n=1 Tax=Streptomyces gamaensis TaxID=1763542 RepID=A0ABW0YY60_9ACTN